MNPLKHPNQLASTPQGKPLYSVTIKDKEEREIHCADPAACRSLIALMDLQAVNGGAAAHWGGPSGCAEIVSAIHAYMFQEKNWFDKYNFVNDIGHAENGIYALRSLYEFGGLKLDDLKKFRSIEGGLTGHGESHLYPEGVLLSNGPLGSSVGQAQGLAMAEKKINRNRTTICVVSDGACMEGEAKEAFAAIPGLAKRDELGPFLMIISDNDTKLSGRISEDTYGCRPTFQSLRALGWHVDYVESGNDLQEVYDAIETASDQVK
jgi:transketolase